MEKYYYNMINLITSTFENRFVCLGIYLLFINIVTFAIYGIDKMKAKSNRWRVSEKTLLGLVLIGGSLGGITAMKIFRHKTKHKAFYIGVPIMLLVHVSLLLYLIF